MGILHAAKVKVYWYECRTGSSTYLGEFKNKGILDFAPPHAGRGNDWVLVLDDASRNFPVPGVSMYKPIPAG